MKNNAREEMITFIEGLRNGAEDVKNDLLNGQEWFDTLENVESDIKGFNVMIEHLQNDTMEDIEDQMIREQYLQIFQMFQLSKTIEKMSALEAMSMLADLAYDDEYDEDEE